MLKNATITAFTATTFYEEKDDENKIVFFEVNRALNVYSLWEIR
jgi:hypothetical protein